jgi:hypothetical protein
VVDLSTTSPSVQPEVSSVDVAVTTHPVGDGATSNSMSESDKITATLALLDKVIPRKHDKSKGTATTDQKTLKSYFPNQSDVTMQSNEAILGSKNSRRKQAKKSDADVVASQNTRKRKVDQSKNVTTRRKSPRKRLVKKSRKGKRRGAKNNPDDSSDSDHASRRELLPDNFTVLPHWVRVTFTDGIGANCIKNVPTEKLEFKVVPTKGDGNCFYYSVTESQIFKDRYPDLIGNVKEVRRQMSVFASQPRNQLFIKKLHEENSISIPVTEWIARIRKMGKQASPGEIRIFARTFGIEVISLMQAEFGLLAIESYDHYRTFCREHNLPFDLEMPNAMETIFMWHHYYEHPELIIDTVDEDEILADHFVLLEHRQLINVVPQPGDCWYNFVKE